MFLIFLASLTMKGQLRCFSVKIATSCSIRYSRRHLSTSTPEPFSVAHAWRRGQDADQLHMSSPFVPRTREGVKSQRVPAQRSVPLTTNLTK